MRLILGWQASESRGARTCGLIRWLVLTMLILLGVGGAFVSTAGLAASSDGLVVVVSGLERTSTAVYTNESASPAVVNGVRVATAVGGRAEEARTCGRLEAQGRRLSASKFVVDAGDPVVATFRPASGYRYDGAVPSYDASVQFAGARTVVHVDAVGRHATLDPFRRQVGAASEGSVSDSGFDVAAKTATYVEAASSRVLAANLKAGGIARPAGSAAHHMVAGNAPRAAEARSVLQRFGVGINDAENGIFLPGNLASPNAAGAAVHSTLHTGAYYQEVNTLMSRAGSQSDVFDSLAYMRGQLQSGGLP